MGDAHRMPKIPRTVAAADERSHEYPPWLEHNCTQFDMARTLAVSGIPDPQMCGAVRAAFCKEFGDNCVEECSAPRNFSRVVYVRLNIQTYSQGCAEPKPGCQCAYEAIETLNEVELELPPAFAYSHKRKAAVYMNVRPAVIRGQLWIGELHDKVNESSLHTALGILNSSAGVISMTVPKEDAYGRSRSWAVVRFRSDEEAAALLLSSRTKMVCCSALPWPIIVEAFAPMEQHEPAFLLTLQTEGAGLRTGQGHPPHFVSRHTLEHEMCMRWAHLHIFHRAQRDALREQQWKERHAAMGNVRPESEKDRWIAGGRDYCYPASRLQRSLFVLGLDKHATKEGVKSIFERYGEGAVERCTVSVRGQYARATVRFRDYVCAHKALRHFNEKQTEPEMKDVIVRHLIENCTLHVSNLDPKITNDMLKHAFEQFGCVKRAQIAMAKNYDGSKLREGERSFCRGFVEFDKHSVASDVLATMQKNMFVMQYSSRPLRVQAYAYGPKRWSSRSPADDLILDHKVENIDPSSEHFETWVQMRLLQQAHRAESVTLRQFQVPLRPCVRACVPSCVGDRGPVPTSTREGVCMLTR
jgi:hypothetical protein